MKKFSLVIVAVIGVFAILSCGSFSGDGEMGTITINIPGSSPGRIAVTPGEIPSLTHIISFQGPGNITPITIPPGNGTQQVRVEVPAGDWIVNVRGEGPNPGYDYTDFPERMLRALGAALATVTAGTTSPANVQMISAVEVSSHEALNIAINEARTDNREKIIIVTANIAAENTYSSYTGQDITIVGRTPGLQITRAPGFTADMFNDTLGNIRFARANLGAVTFAPLTIDGFIHENPYADFIMDGTVITGLVANPSSLNITIPASVTAIQHSAFEGSGVQSIIFAPGSQLQAIGEVAFLNAQRLESIIIPAGVTNIGRSAFSQSGVESVTFAPGSQLQTIELGVFAFTENLTSLEIPASVRTIGQSVFLSSGVQSVTFALGSQLQSIGSSAFREAANLTSIEIPAGVTSIGIYAFRQTTSLTSLEIPASVTTMGNNAFFGWTASQTVTVPFATLAAANAEWGTGWRLLSNATILNNAGVQIHPDLVYGDFIMDGTVITGLVANPSSWSITIPASVTAIANGAFIGSGLQSITFAPDSQLQTIGASAFQNTANLTSLEIPASVTTIGGGGSLFSLSSGIQSITFAPGSQLQTIEAAVFANTANLTSLEIPASVTTIRASAFQNSGIPSLTIPPGVTTMGTNVFDGWTADQTITIPFATLADANAEWGTGWRLLNNATILNNVGVQIHP